MTECISKVKEHSSPRVTSASTINAYLSEAFPSSRDSLLDLSRRNSLQENHIL